MTLMTKVPFILTLLFITFGSTVFSQNNPAPFINTNLTRGQNLRVLRLAVSCTGEYTQAVGGVANAKANLNAWLAQINDIYGREYSVRFELIPNNDVLIFTDPTTDPWATMPAGSSGCQNNQLILDNQGNIIDGIINAANYDISHVILGGVNGGCAGGFKTGYSGGFDLNVTQHEMGHQFSQAHTINNGGNNNYELLGGNWTIQGGNQQSYAHSVSFYELARHLNSTEFNAGTKVPTGNSIPNVDAGPDRVIPISTPFTLRALATDRDTGDVLTYAWDQLDRGIEQASPVGDDSQGALFMRFLPTTSNKRTFPKQEDLLANNYKTTQENLPTQPRDINVRLTVNDSHRFNYNGNSVPASGINSDDIKITVANAGPFQVSSPNTGVTYTGGSTQTIAWLVNGTDQAPINTSHVKISLSADGGLTFPVVLEESTPNDGSHQVIIPNINTTTARIKVEAVGNIYFDISNQDFTINQSQIVPGIQVSLTAGSTIVSENGQQDTYDVSLLTSPTGPITLVLIADQQTEVSLDGNTFGSTQNITLSDMSPQTIIVRGKYDSVEEGSHIGSISHFISASADPINYPSGLPGPPISVSVSDAQIPPVVGVDFDDAPSTSVPANWVKFVGMNNQSATNIPLDDGSPTGIDISITDSSPGQTFDFSNNSGNNTARHSQPLDQTLGGVSVSQGNVQAVWSDLKPNTQYRVFVFGHNVVNGPTNQTITITGNGTNDPPPFVQTVGGSVQINDQTSTNQPLVTFGKVVTSSMTGTITIDITAGGEIWLSALAIQEVLSIPPAGGCPIAEVVSNTTTSGNTISSASIATLQEVSIAGPTVFSSSEITLNAGFIVSSGICFEANNVGCGYTGTVICDDGGNQNMAPDGSCNFPYILTCGQNITGNTATGVPNWSSYGNNDTETGPEIIHTLNVPANTTRTVTLSNYTQDLDLFVLSACDNNAVVGAGVTANPTEVVTIDNNTNNAVTYHIVVDGWSGAVSAYTLTCN